MTASKPQPESSTQPLTLLLFGATENEVFQCEELLSANGYALTSRNILSRAELEQALTEQAWDLLLQSHPVDAIDTRSLTTLLEEQNSASALLMLTTDLADETALQAMRDGVRNIVSLKHPEHLQLTIKQEVEDLANRRLLQHLNTDASLNPKKKHAAPVNKTDLLTGLYTQQYFLSGSQKIFENTPPDHTVQHAILNVKLDRIEEIRHQFGIAVADIIIAEIANCIRSYIPQLYPVARFDDNSFTLLLHKMPYKKAAAVAQKLCKIVSEHAIDVAGAEIKSITCSVGIAVSSEENGSAPLLIKQAQMASEGAIAAGGNLSRLFDPANDEQYGVVKELLNEREDEQKIQQALKDNRFKLLYQPIVSLKSNTAENYEILLRMLDENNEEVLPAEFMPQAVQAGLMPAVDRWVTRNALDELNKRRRNGMDTSFFIKVDHTTLNDDEFHLWLSERLRAKKMPGDALVFEISERSDIKSPETVSHFIGQLNELQCRSGLDHFGDNEMSLERMKRLSVNYLKIDRRLIENICHDDKTKAAIKKLVSAAHKNNQQVIAEFVQDASTLSALWSCGVDYIQGYFLQRPDDTMGYDFTEEN